LSFILCGQFLCLFVAMFPCVICLLESLHVLACPSKSQAGGRDPAIYVLIKHRFRRLHKWDIAKWPCGRRQVSVAKACFQSRVCQGRKPAKTKSALISVNLRPKKFVLIRGYISPRNPCNPWLIIEFFSAFSVTSVAYQFSTKSAGSCRQKSKNLKIFYLLF